METASWSTAVRDAAASLTEGVVSHLPGVVGATLILAAGWIVGRLVNKRSLISAMVDLKEGMVPGLRADLEEDRGTRTKGIEGKIPAAG